MRRGDLMKRTLVCTCFAVLSMSWMHGTWAQTLRNPPATRPQPTTRPAPPATAPSRTPTTAPATAPAPSERAELAPVDPMWLEKLKDEDRVPLEELRGWAPPALGRELTWLPERQG